MGRLSNLLTLQDGVNFTREEIQIKLESSTTLLNKIIADLDVLRGRQQRFEDKRVSFVLGKRMEELNTLTSKEINLNAKQDKELLFDPTYE